MTVHRVYRSCRKASGPGIAPRALHMAHHGMEINAVAVLTCGGGAAGAMPQCGRARCSPCCQLSGCAASLGFNVRQGCYIGCMAQAVGLARVLHVESRG